MVTLERRIEMDALRGDGAAGVGADLAEVAVALDDLVTELAPLACVAAVGRGPCVPDRVGVAATVADTTNKLRSPRPTVGTSLRLKTRARATAEDASAAETLDRHLERNLPVTPAVELCPAVRTVMRNRSTRTGALDNTAAPFAVAQTMLHAIAHARLRIRHRGIVRPRSDACCSSSRWSSWTPPRPSPPGRWPSAG